MKRGFLGVGVLAGLVAVHWVLREVVIQSRVAAALLSPGPHLPLEAIALALSFLAVRLGLYVFGPAALVWVLAVIGKHARALVAAAR